MSAMAARASVEATGRAEISHSTGAAPSGAGRPRVRSSRMLTTRSPCRGDLHIGANHMRRQQREAYVAAIDKVAVDITVVLGTTSMPIHQVLRLGRGAILELDSSEDDPVQILANNLPVANGTVVVNGNRIAVEVGQLLPRPADMR